MSMSLEARLLQHITQHSTSGILLDTNMLLLFIFATYMPEKIGGKRLSKYDIEAGELLKQYVARFTKILTTAHVLAETSNLARQIVKDQTWMQMSAYIFPRFCGLSDSSFAQCHLDPTEVNPIVFSQLGMTDASLSIVVSGQRLLLTDDLDLYLSVLSDGNDAINFTHMREAAGLL
jgi:hypothetical protein